MDIDINVYITRLNARHAEQIASMQARIVELECILEKVLADQAVPAESVSEAE